MWIPPVLQHFHLKLPKVLKKKVTELRSFQAFWKKQPACHYRPLFSSTRYLYEFLLEVLDGNVVGRAESTIVRTPDFAKNAAVVGFKIIFFIS